MLRGFIRLMGLKFNSPEAGAFAYSLVTLLVTLVGIFRERLFATVIGPGPTLDAYVLAHKIPDVLYVTTAALFVASTILPYVAKEETKQDKDRLMSEMFTILTIGSMILAVVTILCAGVIAPIIGPGFDADTLHMSVSMTRVLLISPVLMGVSNLLSVTTNAHKQFIVVALSPLLYNIATVLGVYWGYQSLGYMALPVSILVAALCHMGVQVIANNHHGVIPTWVSGINWRRAGKIILNAVPRTLAVAAVPVTSLGMIAIGSHLPSGSVSILNFAIVIQNVPVTLIGGSMAVASFPALVDMARDRALFATRLVRSLRLIMLLSLPVIALMYILRIEIVSLLFNAGQFTAEHVQLTASIVGILILGIWAQSITLMAARIYYARNKTWQPFIQNVIATICSLGFAYLTYYAYGANLVYIALAYVFGWWVNAIINLIKVGGAFCAKDDVANIVRGCADATLAGGVAYITGSVFYQLVSSYVTHNSFVGLAIRSAVVGLGAVVSSVLVLLLVNNKEVSMFLRFLKKKFGGSISSLR